MMRSSRLCIYDLYITESVAERMNGYTAQFIYLSLIKTRKKMFACGVISAINPYIITIVKA